MIQFDLDRFLKDHHYGVSELVPLVGMTYMAIVKIKKRGTVKPKFIRHLESHFGDCSKYIIKSEINHGKRVA